MANIVIMGAGIGGMPAAYEMRELLPKEHTVTVVSAMDFFQFVPSNPWLAVGWRKREEIVLKIAPLLERKGIQFIAKPVTTLDAAGNKLVLSGGTADEQVLPYDYLVITTGPKLSFDEVPGAGPHGGHTHSVCSVDHAESFWKDYQEFLKNPGPVVIGAMPMASCFGPAYEFAFILDTDLRKRKLRNKVPITFVSSEPYIGHLGLGGVGDSKSMLESEMRNRDMKWITNAKTTKVEAGKMFVTQLDDLGNVIQGARSALQDVDDAAGVSRRGPGRRRGWPVQPARFRTDRCQPAQPQVPQHLLGRGVRGDPAGRGHTGAHRRRPRRAT
jgi:sulfide:quinone oxidoreductase